MSADIFLCFGCGKRNRLPKGADRTAARCGGCGDPLFPNETRSNKSQQKQSDNAAPDRRSAQPSRPPSPATSAGGIGLVGKVFWFGLAAIIAWFIFAGPETSTTASRQGPSQPSSSVPARTPVETSVPALQNLPPPVTQSPGVLWNRTGRRLQAPLSIRTGSGANYYIKLIDENTGSDAVAIYARGGHALNVEIPLGSYRVRYASGETWRGEQALFGPGNHTQYSEAGTVFHFRIEGNRVLGYTIELIAQRGGNLPTRRIQPGQF